MSRSYMSASDVENARKVAVWGWVGRFGGVGREDMKSHGAAVI